MRDLKGFARAQSIFIELVVKDVNLSSVPVNPGPSDKSPPESAIIPPLGLKVADQRVSGDFEVGYTVSFHLTAPLNEKIVRNFGRRPSQSFFFAVK